MKHLPLFALLALTGAVSCLPGGPKPSDEVALADTATMTGAVLTKRPPPIEIVIEKQFTFDKYTLADTFPYRDTVRIFQWDKIRMGLQRLDSILALGGRWAVVQNRLNQHGVPPLPREWQRDAYNSVADMWGVQRRNAIPLYTSADSLAPERYALDGSLCRLFSEEGDSLAWLEPLTVGGRWMTPAKFVRAIPTDSLRFDHAVFVDRLQQCIATLQRGEGHTWLVRSTNPCTTGRHHPPYQMETPLGVFVIQEKKVKMIFLQDGGTEVEGFAPWANRFCNGGYLHGVPVNLPRTELIEYAWTLGTTPRSHMCVRNATSHAQFIFDNFPTLYTAVFVIE